MGRTPYDHSMMLRQPSATARTNGAVPFVRSIALAIAGRDTLPSATVSRKDDNLAIACPKSHRGDIMAKKFPIHPQHPERLCWGCDHYCPADDMRCGNGQSRTQHPAELLGDDWLEQGDWGIEVDASGKNVTP